MSNSLTASWRTRVKQLTGDFLDFIFPPVCANCGKIGTLLCDSCIARMPVLHEPVCPLCGRPVKRSGQSCSRCQESPPSLNQIRAAVLFEDAVPHLIHQLKYNGMFALAEPFASIMASSWHHWRHPVDVVVPIPLHRRREKARGYNQSEMLSRHLSRMLEIPQERHALKRVRNTPPQIELIAEDRAANVTGAFAADHDSVRGRRILLIDDVCTTGSTLSEAARALSEAGAVSVSGYCLARAV